MVDHVKNKNDKDYREDGKHENQNANSVYQGR